LPVGAAAPVALFQDQIKNLLGEGLLAAGICLYFDDVLSDERGTCHATRQNLQHAQGSGTQGFHGEVVFHKDIHIVSGKTLSNTGVSVNPDRMQAPIDETGSKLLL
jgi:hypothetical protein